jgi:hypothetical protein
MAALSLHLILSLGSASLPNGLGSYDPSKLNMRSLAFNTVALVWDLRSNH